MQAVGGVRERSAQTTAFHKDKTVFPSHVSALTAPWRSNTAPVHESAHFADRVHTAMHQITQGPTVLSTMPSRLEMGQFKRFLPGASPMALARLSEAIVAFKAFRAAVEYPGDARSLHAVTTLPDGPPLSTLSQPSHPPPLPRPPTGAQLRDQFPYLAVLALLNTGQFALDDVSVITLGRTAGAQADDVSDFAIVLSRNRAHDCPSNTESDGKHHFLRKLARFLVDSDEVQALYNPLAPGDRQFLVVPRSAPENAIARWLGNHFGDVGLMNSQSRAADELQRRGVPLPALDQG
jgi:hypothetical protein